MGWEGHKPDLQGGDMQHSSEGWTATRWGARLIDGKAVRTIDAEGDADSVLGLLTLVMSLPSQKLLVVSSEQLHSNWTKSPPLIDKAIIALGDIKTLASSQPLPASIKSVIWSCCGLLIT
jgi:hypothetical protein